MIAKRIILFVIAFLFFSPFLMYICWLLQPKEKLVVAIIDKTVLDGNGQEHISFNWVLNYEKLSKTSTQLYKIDRDYFGFFPLEEKKFNLKGLEQFSSRQLKKLSRDADMVYYTDTYGIYNNEWYDKGDINARSGLLYGGLSNNDVEYLQHMKAKKKLILTEFNVIGSPTNTPNRLKFEEMFGLRWTGWTGRYFDVLDPLKNKELPSWLIDGYERINNQKWPFTKSGVAFVNKDGTIVVLEKDKHLSISLPFILSTLEGHQDLDIPEKTNYPFWFDIMEADNTINTVSASYNIDTNSLGEKILAKYDIPSKFPAVIGHTGQDYNFYYFCGDFSDNPISINSSYFKGIPIFKDFFYDARSPLDRGNFFWNFYRPLISNILENYKD